MNQEIEKYVSLIVLAGIVLGGGYWAYIKYQEHNYSAIGAQANVPMPPSNMPVPKVPTNASDLSGASQSPVSANGEVISITAHSATIKMTDGTSKTLYFTSSTTVQTTQVVTLPTSSLKPGQQISAVGVLGSDGSITAAMIQLFTSAAVGAGGAAVPPSVPPTPVH